MSFWLLECGFFWFSILLLGLLLDVQIIFGDASTDGGLTSYPKTEHFRTQHVPAPVKGAINAANWSLKRDYERLLDANGWSKHQLTALSTVHDIVYLDHASLQPPQQTDVHRSTVQAQPPREEGNVTFHYNRSCPHNITLQFTGLGREFRGSLTLNKYIRSPELQIRTVTQSMSEMVNITSSKSGGCYYHLRNHESFGTFFRGVNGFIRAYFHAENQSLVLGSLSVNPSSDRPPKIYGPRPLDLRLPHLLYAKKGDPNTSSSNCGVFQTMAPKKISRIHTDHRKHRRGGRLLFPRRPSRSPRDVRLQLKWIELGLIFDSSLLNLIKSAHEDPADVALHLTNLIDQIFQPLKTRAVLSYLELWTENNQIHITRDISATLLNLMSYSTEHLFSVQFDSLQLLTASTKGFLSEDFGIASTNTVCTLKSVGIVHASGPGLDLISLAAKTSHMIAHNLGMQHDAVKDRECICPSDGGCLMQAQSLVDAEDGVPIFSSCSQDDYVETLHTGQGTCLLTSPFQESELSPTCGNGIVDQSEDCDCGSFVECLGKSPCCDPITCRFKEGAVCAGGACCTAECKFKREGSLCRETASECDLSEHCTGADGQCPSDGFKKSGYICGDGAGYCYNRTCVTYDEQCQEIWGLGSTAASKECRDYFVQGVLPECKENGLVQCPAASDALCGPLTCQGGTERKLNDAYTAGFTAAITVVTTNGHQFQCKTVTRTADEYTEDAWEDFGSHSLAVKNGTKCGGHKVCINGLCTPLVLRDRDLCPTNNRAIICSGHGDCDDLNKCSCRHGFIGSDCSARILDRFNAHSSSEVDSSNARRTLPDNIRSASYELLDQFMMPLIMAALIGLFLIIFLFALLCYKRSSNSQSELTDFYSESNHSGASYDLSSPTSKLTSDYHHYLPTGLRYVSVPTSDLELSSVLFTCVENSPESSEKLSQSPVDIQPSPQLPRRPSKQHASVSPFIARRQSARRQFSRHRPDDWMSAPETCLDSPLPYLDLTYTPPCRPELNTSNMSESPKAFGRIRIKDFDQLLQQLDSGCGEKRVVDGTSSRSKMAPLVRVKTRDADCQVNLDLERGLSEITGEVAVPSPMSELKFPAVVSEQRVWRDVWQPQKMSGNRNVKHTPMGSPQRRRYVAGLRRQERHGVSQLQRSLDLSSESEVDV